MTPAERLARAQRAETAYREFLEPMIDQMKNEYADRIVEHATTELNSKRLADKLAKLSTALKILTTLDAGMHAIISDGDVALRDKVKADKIEQMPAPQRRLLNIGPF